MDSLLLYAKIESLPVPLREQVAEFIQSLLNQLQTTKPPTKPRPRFGSAKGMFVMAPDFDEPLADFHEYMYP
ncbi:MAG: DUF2281 domain-containing protein [Saprospiraceae bacterium]